MFEGFPYTNFHELNLDWIIKIAKDFLDQYTNIQQTITDGLNDIQESTETGVSELETKYNTLRVLLDQWYETHSADIANELLEAIASFNTAADAKAAETIASIPDDYTTLANNVTNLSNMQIINGFVRFIHDDVPAFSKSGTTITVTPPNQSILVSYPSSYNTYRIWQYKNPDTNTYSVPTGSLFAFDLDLGTFVVETATTATLTNKKYINCFINNNGDMYGDWEHYTRLSDVQKQNRLNVLNGLAFFRYGMRPRFELSGTTYTITFPDTTTVCAYPSSSESYRIWVYKATGVTSVSLPDASALVYNLTDASFQVKSGTSFTLDKDYILCCTNNLGTIHGPWAEYLIEQQLEEYPSYYDAYIASKIGTINQNVMEAINGDSFVFISDIHTDGNMNYSPNLIKKIIHDTSVDKVILNGDYIQQEATKEAALTKINSVINNYIYPNAQTLRVVGNHEFNTNGSISPAPELTWQELYYPIIKPNENKIIRQTNGLGYVFINEAQKIKYMVGTYNKAAGMDLASIRFLHNHITDTPAGYTLVFIFHGGVNTNGSYQSGMDSIISLCDAIRNKTTYTWAYNTFDFTNADYTVACVMVGHQHIDKSFLSQSDMPIIMITCDAYAYNMDTDVTRAQNELSEQAFDVVTINTTAKTIKCTRIGGGSNRSFTY